MPEDLVLHDLRDTAAALMISSGASIVAVAQALGHASPRMTLDVCGGRFVSDLKELADRMEHRHGGVGDTRAARVAAEILPFPK